MDLPVKPTLLIRDLDGKFPEQFDAILESAGRLLLLLLHFKRRRLIDD